MEKPFDVICMGRVAVDLYSQQIGARLEDASSFAKYLGGSSGNVAYGTARQGLRSSMLARVGDEHMGRFLREELRQVGCDTCHLIIDKERLTALVLLGIKDQDTFPLIFYRDNCADMAISADDVEEAYIASSRCLAITGTHLSHPQTRNAVLTALGYARRHGVRTVLDIDYRPVLWGLTSLGDGETRFIAADRVSRELQEVLHLFDVIVGTEEEFHIAGGSIDTLQALTQVRRVSPATLVCKRGARGCSVYTDAIPSRLDDGLTVTGVRVEILNVLGAGDAFMSGLLRGYLNDEGWEQSCRYANACGALVVSRHGCSPAMPSKIELDDYLSRERDVPRPDLDPRLNHLHRVTTRRRVWPELCVMAFDHRSQLEDMAMQCGASLKRIPMLKNLILQASRAAAQDAELAGRAGLLCDGTFGQDALNAITGEGWWIGRPIELPGSRPLEMELGNIGTQLISWPQEHVVKCLVLYHPEDEHTLRLAQEQSVAEVYRACCQSGHELLLELILPPDMSHSDDLYLRAVSRFYNLGIYPDWWKLPPLSSAGWSALEAILERCDPHCRGVVILGLDAPAEQLRAGFNAAAAHAWVKGFAVGRTLFGDAARAWLKHDIDDAQLVARIRDNYLQLIAWWRERGQA
ncbi:bifunctional 5-dehydro-2-deoxygluconokinase/5-dehydro-2-deoxyphosphogluconate aldolase [Edwardsiella anguillarum]|uniref:bifunctional 5-dehydro-2-deoxygluconokinase/5-dehydro-2- deoxyphosphogluconate aldolase n=1 Tax=Edwardsiella anguillarum TaxID=1821960 RepID=UPI0024B7DA73|nr:5-dehydro-2-deoxygluconokinase [Edwardsiella anguillarum]WHP81871.1 5-dehydro-2-deoxygluconokinase [Edwardsiella anguillarum]WHQ19374.1 5-dehydro-2-deoxygluconokinase [Edwardsiella anguillarum]WHQ22919.1 5-dehydro-2-deoxygluconokinase [Edwardsiella anguillarum]WHQ26444.1 5-dehydro-2-deoxygluconokinase [Edwardsiella anguillarum]WHQ29957.1 5-dehydro-2-deoxygluconokinase [Edwardsiella anguillarum]